MAGVCSMATPVPARAPLPRANVLCNACQHLQGRVQGGAGVLRGQVSGDLARFVRLTDTPSSAKWCCLAAAVSEGFNNRTRLARDGAALKVII